MEVIVYIFPKFENFGCREKDVKDNKLNSLYFAGKFAEIFVLGHYLFLEGHSFAQATLSAMLKVKFRHGLHEKQFFI